MPELAKGVHGSIGASAGLVGESHSTATPLPAKRLYIVTTGLDYGGAEIQTVALAKAFRQRGWEVRLASLMPPLAFVEELNALGINIDSFGVERNHRPGFRLIWQLRKAIKAFEPDIIHSHTVHSNLLSRFSRPLFYQAPLVCTAHSIFEGSKWRNRLYRISDHRCAVTTQVSRAGIEHAVKDGRARRERMRYIPNGIDLSRFNVAENSGLTLRTQLGLDNKFVWLTVGRQETPKDYPNLLMAFATLEVPKAVLVVAGSGSLLVEMQALAASLKISDSVLWLGDRSDIPELMSMADAYVSASAWEGLPMVLLEAGISGLPSVATNVGGCSDIVEQEASGLLVPPQNSPALADAMQSIMLLPTHRRRAMGSFAKQHIEASFSLDSVVDRWLELYSQLGVSE